MGNNTLKGKQEYKNMSKFEKKFSRYAIPNLSLYLIIAYIIGYAIQILSPEMYQLLMFDPYMIFHGQVWRIITWILMPPETLGVFTIIMLILYYQLGRGLEHTWGTYRYNVYMFSGLLFTVIGALVLYVVMLVLYSAGIMPDEITTQMLSYGIVSPGQFFGTFIGLFVSTYYINMSIFLAYAVTYPEEQLMLYFLVPIRIKWFGYLYAAYLIYDIIKAFKTGSFIVGITVTVLIFVSLLNFLIYVIFGRNRARFNPKQAKRRHEYKQSVRQAKPKTYENGARHKCVICGRTEIDDPNLTFRYCSKCSGNKEYCQDHLFTHEHH